MADLLREKRRACGLHRAEFKSGGGSSSSKNETSTQDSRITQQSGTAVSGNNNQVLDGGAIANAFAFSGDTLAKTLEFASQSGAQALEFASNSGAQALDSLNTTTTLVKNAYEDAKGRGAMTDYVILGGMALAGLIAVTALKK